MASPVHTARQMLPAVGQPVLIAFEQICVACHVVDVKKSYGQVRLLVRPITGLGAQWVELGRLRSEGGLR